MISVIKKLSIDCEVVIISIMLIIITSVILPSVSKKVWQYYCQTFLFKLGRISIDESIDPI